MLTLVGKDRAGIVAKVSTALCQKGCYLGEANMSRLGKNFTMMLMVHFKGPLDQFTDLVDPVAKRLELNYHVDLVEGGWHNHIQPNVRISVKGLDRKGIVEEVTTVLAERGLNILNLDSTVTGTEESPTYNIFIEGVASKGFDPLYEALQVLSKEKDLETQLIPIVN